MSARYGTVLERFERSYLPEPMSGCWLWCEGIDEAGYSRFRVGSTKVRMHRWSYEQHRGPIPEGLYVLHRCDIPSCVNPDHLFLGTLADNVADKVQKDRQAKGRASPSAKLSEHDIRVIRESNETQRALAAKFGVVHTTIGQIKRREKWRHVE